MRNNAEFRTVVVKQLAVTLVAGVAGIAGCGLSSAPADPFSIYTDQFGRNLVSNNNQSSSGGSGSSATTTFRQTMTLTLANHDGLYELNSMFAAWVLPNSFTSAEQQDQLLTAGYVQLTSEAKIGSVYTLPAGTFVFNGAGNAGSTNFTIPHGTAASSDPASAVTAASIQFSFPSPDVLLVYLAPPTSCDSPAFVFTESGSVADVFHYGAEIYGGSIATIDGPTKTLSQIDAYQCSPFKPGLFLRKGGGSRADNEFFEGNGVTFDFFRVADPTTQTAALVTIGG